MYTKLFQPCGIKEIKQYIKNYFDIFVKDNIERLMQVSTREQIKNNLCEGIGLNEIKYKQFLITTYSEKNMEIRAIYCVLRRLMTGELNEMDDLMISLRKANETISIENYNITISMEIKSLVLNYLSTGQACVMQLPQVGIDSDAGAGCESSSTI